MKVAVALALALTALLVLLVFAGAWPRALQAAVAGSTVLVYKWYLTALRRQRARR